MKKYIIIGLVLIVGGIGYYTLSPLFIRSSANDVSPLAAENSQNQNVSPVSEVTTTVTTTTTSSSTPSSPAVIAEGTFKPQVHEVSGKATIINSSSGQVLRFENFYTLNGPDLHVYLSKDLTNKDYVEVGNLKATDGNINYDIPAGTDTSVYSHVLIWCKTFSVLFGSADLSAS